MVLGGLGNVRFEIYTFHNLDHNTCLSRCALVAVCAREKVIPTYVHVLYRCDSYMDMALGCVVKAVSGELMGNCMLSNDQQIKSHLTTLQKSKLDVCENKGKICDAHKNNDTF